MRYESGDFTPVEVTKIGQLEHLLQSEQDVSEVRTLTQESPTRKFVNPSFNPDFYKADEPPFFYIDYTPALVRGMIKMKKALHDDVVYTDEGKIQREKKMIVNGLLEGYNNKL